MAWTIIRQPNGKLMVWSSVVEEPVYYDITEKEYIEIMANEAREKAKSDLERKSFVKESSWINSLICAYGRDTEELDELVNILCSVGYDTKKIRNIINEQLAEELEDESQDIKQQNCTYIPTKLANLWFGYDN